MKQGDKVAIYSGEGRFVGKIIDSDPEDDLVQVAFKHPEYGRAIVIAHKKQCRVLKKKVAVQFKPGDTVIYKNRLVLVVSQVNDDLVTATTFGDVEEPTMYLDHKSYFLKVK